MVPYKFLFPELILTLKRYSVGFAQQLLLPEQELSIQSTEKFKVSSRTTLDCLILTTGQRIIVTTKPSMALPTGIDGILRKLENGRYVWIAHKLIKEANEEIEKNGLAKYSKRLASSWPSNFRYKVPERDIYDQVMPNSNGLRPPQIGALFSIGSHWSLNNIPATIIMPTGTGKTETMLAALAAHATCPMIVAVPSKALRGQTARKFLTFGLLRKLETLPLHVPNPVVGILRSQPRTKDDLDIFRDCNVIVSVMASLTGGTAKDLAKDIAGECGVLIVDEAHHIGASTWTNFKEEFSKKRVLQFTATPFRADGKLVDGDVIFSYPLRQAQKDGYFKPIQFKPVYELNPQAGDDLIAKEACQVLRSDLESGYNHLLMARCDSIHRAQEVKRYYDKYGKEFDPQIIHSELVDGEVRVQRLIKGESKIAICVNMLGEGFDLPALKIAAMHDPQKSLAPLLQFTGRFTRTSGINLGDAKVIANIADPGVSIALERLYSEDSDWNSILSEMSSQAAKDHASLIEFLNDSISLVSHSDEIPSLSHHLLKPIFSTLFYSCSVFRPKKFFEAIPKGIDIANVWLNEKTNTLYFATRSQGRVKWTRSKEIIDTSWNLFVLHHDEERNLLYLASSDKTSSHEGLAKAVGATGQLMGEDIFRSLGRIGRLVFNNLGVSKHGRRNLSYAMYTGADVRQALGLSEKAGSRKANISGIGWENGKQVTIGCSYKGRVWSKDAGTIPELVEWAKNVGDKVTDKTISTADIIDNVLIPDEIKVLPKVPVLGIEWPFELLRQPEERVIIANDNISVPIYLCDIVFNSVNYEANEIEFHIVDNSENLVGVFVLAIDDSGYAITEKSIPELSISIGTNQTSLATYFNQYPPLIRFVDLSELDGNLILKPQNPYNLTLPSSCLSVFDWSDADITKESIWKDGVKREHSVQFVAAKKFIDDGFDFVFDDDSPGEAADLICIKEEDTFIRLLFAHCKFSGGKKAGARVEDLVEVSSQAIRSAKWTGKFKELCRHILNRNETRVKEPGRSFILRGRLSDINRLSKVSRLKAIRPEIMLVQPGVSVQKMSDDQNIVLGAAASYLKETIGVDITVLCSE